MTELHANRQRRHFSRVLRRLGTAVILFGAMSTMSDTFAQPTQSTVEEVVHRIAAATLNVEGIGAVFGPVTPNRDGSVTAASDDPLFSHALVYAHPAGGFNARLTLTNRSTRLLDISGEPDAFKIRPRGRVPYPIGRRTWRFAHVNVNCHLHLSNESTAELRLVDRVSFVISPLD